jgi:hypothetical protein
MQERKKEIDQKGKRNHAGNQIDPIHEWPPGFLSSGTLQSLISPKVRIEKRITIPA